MQIAKIISWSFMIKTKEEKECVPEQICLLASHAESICSQGTSRMECLPLTWECRDWGFQSASECEPLWPEVERINQIAWLGTLPPRRSLGRSPPVRRGFACFWCTCPPVSRIHIQLCIVVCISNLKIATDFELPWSMPMKRTGEGTALHCRNEPQARRSRPK